MRELYEAENRQDRTVRFAGYDRYDLSGINRLDYDFAFEGGVFPRHIESTERPGRAAWLEGNLRSCRLRRGPTDTTRWVKEPRSPMGRPAGEVRKDCYDAISAGITRPGSIDERMHGLLGNDPAADGASR